MAPRMQFVQTNPQGAPADSPWLIGKIEDSFPPEQAGMYSSFSPESEAGVWFGVQYRSKRYKLITYTPFQGKKYWTMDWSKVRVEGRPEDVFPTGTLGPQGNPSVVIRYTNGQASLNVTHAGWNPNGESVLLRLFTFIFLQPVPDALSAVRALLAAPEEDVPDAPVWEGGFITDAVTYDPLDETIEGHANMPSPVFQDASGRGTSETGPGGGVHTSLDYTISEESN